ncbi:MAG: hypothetical protein GAK34_02847 [Delftia tsuruhatensis]|nr:MAG: hypothetical protein GAK34_02847 [Delftia tsuruhatensis]
MMPSASMFSNMGSPLACSSASLPETLATRPFCADTGNTRSTGRPSIWADSWRWRCSWACTCVAELRLSHSVSILLSTTSRESASACWPDAASCGSTWSRQMARSDLVTPVSAASTKTTAWAWGMRLTVSSGSAPTAFRPGVSRMTSPCLSRGWGMLISAWRHMGTSTRPCSSTKGLPPWSSSCQKPQVRARSTDTLRTSATLASVSAICWALFTSSGSCSQASGRARHWPRLSSDSRVSMGSRRRLGCSSASQPSSAGHMVVRPALAGMRRRP